MRKCQVKDPGSVVAPDGSDAVSTKVNRCKKAVSEIEEVLEVVSSTRFIALLGHQGKRLSTGYLIGSILF